MINDGGISCVLNTNAYTLEFALDICRQSVLPDTDVLSFAELDGMWNKTDNFNDALYQWHQPLSQPVEFPVVTRTFFNSGVQKGPFECPTCHKTYSHKSNLGRHTRLECGKEPQFQCPFCPQRTTQNSSLQKHIERHHL